MLEEGREDEDNVLCTREVSGLSARLIDGLVGEFGSKALFRWPEYGCVEWLVETLVVWGLEG